MSGADAGGVGRGAAEGAGRHHAPYAAAIFDMDGLLLDSERPIRAAWLQAAREHGAQLGEDDYQRVIGINVRESEAVLSFLLGGAERYASIRARADQLIDDARYAPKAGARELLALLEQKCVARAIASSTVRREMRRRLDAAGLARYVETVTGGDEVPHGRGKPCPDLYLLAARRIGIAPDRCLVFEDSAPGAKAGLAAGMGVVIVPDLKRPPDDVCEAASMVLPSLEMAIGHCAEWFGR